MAIEDRRTIHGLPIINPQLELAINEIKGTYGDRVSVEEKAKNLLKFGRNEAVGTSPATIMTLPAGINEETYVSTNIIDTVSSSNAADTQEIVIEGHTVDSTGFTFVSQTVTLNGQNKVTLSTPLARATRAYNNDSVNLQGAVYVYEDGTISGGVPTTGSSVHLIIPLGDNQSQKASSTISKEDYYIVTSVYVDVLEKASAFTIVEFQTREFGKVFREKADLSASNSSRGLFPFDPYFIVTPNSDFRLQATAGGANTDVSGGVNGYLAKII